MSEGGNKAGDKEELNKDGKEDNEAANTQGREERGFNGGGKGGGKGFIRERRETRAFSAAAGFARGAPVSKEDTDENRSEGVSEIQDKTNKAAGKDTGTNDAENKSGAGVITKGEEAFSLSFRTGAGFIKSDNSLSADG